MNDFRKKVGAGVFWSSVSVLSERILGIVTVAFLARILDPKDFAIVAIATMAISFTTYFTDVGFEAALIQYKNEIEKAANTAFYIIVALCSVAYLLLYFTAPYIAGFYGNYQISGLIKLIALNLIIQSVSRTHNILLSKELDFKNKSICEIVPNVLYGFVSILLAIRGYGVWSIAYGMVIKSCGRTIMLYFVSKWRPKLSFDISIAKSIMSYGRHVMTNNFLNFCSENIDNAMIGKLLGLTPLSFYKMSYNAANMTSQVSYQILGRVAIPAVARLQDDKKAMIEMFMKMISYSLFVVTPVFFALYFFADEFIGFLYGAKWAQSIPLFRTLLIFGYFSMLRMFSSNLFLAAGQPQYLPRMTLIRVMLLVVIVWLGKDYGLPAICLGVSLMEACLALMQLWLQKKIFGIRILLFVKATLQPSLIAGGMLISLYLSRKVCEVININNILSIIIEIIAGMVVYGGTIYMVSSTIRSKIHVYMQKNGGI